MAGLENYTFPNQGATRQCLRMIKEKQIGQGFLTSACSDRTRESVFPDISGKFPVRFKLLSPTTPAE
jgi:hypothetical protein